MSERNEYEAHRAVANARARAESAGFVVCWSHDGWILESNRVFRGRTAAEMQRFLDGYEASPAGSTPVPDLVDDDVEWVVNDSAELGVKIGDRFFWLYKGGTLVYNEGTHDDGSPMLWRPVAKREFGETCHPEKYREEGHHLRESYEVKLMDWSLGENKGVEIPWLPLPPMPRYTNSFERNCKGAVRPEPPVAADDSTDAAE
jgi:hypothetical protein